MRRGKGEEQAWNKTQIPHSDLQTFTRACLSLHLNQYAYWPQLFLFIFFEHFTLFPLQCLRLGCSLCLGCSSSCSFHGWIFLAIQISLKSHLRKAFLDHPIQGTHRVLLCQVTCVNRFSCLLFLFLY